MPIITADKKASIDTLDIIDVDSSAYAAQRATFLKNLTAFHEQRGTSVYKTPCFGGKKVDLFLLYKQVTKHGGWERVSTDNNWDVIYTYMYPEKSCANADYALKQLYARYLYYYEKYNFYGLEGEVKDDSAETDESRRNLQHFLASIPFTYNYSQHPPPATTEENAYNSNYHSLERSLSSGLPNEIDFAINVCLLLSNDSKHSLRGSKAVKVVELLLSHVGILKPGSNYKWQHKRDTHFNFYKFWDESVDDEVIKDLVCPESLMTKSLESVIPSRSNIPRDPNVPRLQGTYDKECLRITQIAHVIRNFLADDVNVDLLAPNLIIFRFLMLCVYNKLGIISQLGLEALTYLSNKLSLEPVDCKLSELMLTTIQMCLESSDRAFIIRGCEMLSNVAQNDSNEEVLEGYVKEGVLATMLRYLTLTDLPLSMASLEALYQLSEASPDICNVIASCHKAIDTLVDILTLDAPLHYGCPSLEPEPFVPMQAPQLPIQIQLQQNQLSQQLVAQQNQVPQVLPSQQQTSNQQVTLQQQLSSTIQNQQKSTTETIQQKQQPFAYKPSSNQTAQKTISSTLDSNLDGKEKLAFDWLTTQYEYSKDTSNVTLSKMDLYRCYVSERSVCGLQNIISPGAFEKCIRAAFNMKDEDESIENIVKCLVRKTDTIKDQDNETEGNDDHKGDEQSKIGSVMITQSNITTSSLTPTISPITSTGAVSSITSTAAVNILTTSDATESLSKTAEPTSVDESNTINDSTCVSESLPTSSCNDVSNTLPDSTNGDKTVVSGSSDATASSSKPTTFKYFCDWSGCTSDSFEDYNAIYHHVMSQHLPQAGVSSNSQSVENSATNQPDAKSFQCQWAGCNYLPRMKWSFAAHLLDRHLNRQILQITSLHRLDPSHPLPPPQPSTIYPNNAAIQAIHKLTPRALFHELMDMREDRLSKHLHLTAALLLRNLARSSVVARNGMRKHESHLAHLAFSCSEASMVLSSCLCLLHPFNNPL